MTRSVRNLCLLLLLLFTVANNAMAAEPVGRLTGIKGEVKIERGGATLSVKENEPLIPEDVIRTGKDSRVKIELAVGGYMVLDGGSRLQMSADVVGHEPPRFFLHLGHLFHKAASLVQRAEPGIETPTAIIGVRGTEYGVAVADTGETLVAVAQGEVEVEGPEDSATLKPQEEIEVGLSGKLPSRARIKEDIEKRMSVWRENKLKHLPEHLAKFSQRLDEHLPRLMAKDRELIEKIKANNILLTEMRQQLQTEMPKVKRNLLRHKLRGVWTKNTIALRVLASINRKLMGFNLMAKRLVLFAENNKAEFGASYAEVNTSLATISGMEDKFKAIFKENQDIIEQSLPLMQELEGLFKG